MGFDEEIGDHIPGLVREFVPLCHHRVPFRRCRRTLQNFSFRGASIQFLGIRTEPNTSLLIYVNAALTPRYKATSIQ